MKHFIIKSSIATTLMLACVALVFPFSTSAAFNQNNIMSDAVFNNSNSMNAAQIDAFLNSFPNSCISTNRGFSSPNVVGYNPSQGFLYGSNVSAGTVINNAAKAYDLNPQVLLATLQKEQSLVSGNAGCHYNTPPTLNPCPQKPYGTYNECVTACQYAGGCVYVAVGYDCPYYCVVNSIGFSKQIIKAAWKLKFVQQRSLGNYNWNVQKPGWNNSDDPSTAYDGYMTQGTLKRNSWSAATYHGGTRPVNSGSLTVHLGSGATASLYSYTPFTSGNANFVNIFESWFGSTQGSRWQPLQDPRIMVTNKNTYKINPDTQQQVQSLDANTQIKFATKTDLQNGSTCLRTQHDTTNKVNACVPIADLSEFSPSLSDINTGGAPSMRSSLQWTCKVDYLRDKVTDQCFDTPLTVTFQKRVTTLGVDYIITKHDADNGFTTAFRADRFSSSSVWSSLIDPRIMTTNKPTHKINPFTGEKVQSISIGEGIKFQTKSGECLRTQHDTTNNINACIPMADLDDFSPSLSDINTGGAPSMRSSLQWTCKVDYLRDKVTDQCFDKSTIVAFRKKVTILGIEYIITKHDFDNGFKTAFRADRFSQSQ